FGAVDWSYIPAGTRAKRVGAVHGIGNIAVVLMFMGSWYLRSAFVTPPTRAFVLSFMGVGLALVTGWLGGELVTRLGVGVDRDADVNAPASFRSGLVASTPKPEERRQEEEWRRAG